MQNLIGPAGVERARGGRVYVGSTCVGNVLGAGFSSLALVAGLGLPLAHAADLGYAPPPPVVVYDVGVDARCRIIPAPELNLVGDTARFRPQAVCQSRGLYADSLGFPEPPVFYGYTYGYAR